MDVFDLVAKITLDDSGYKSGLDEAKSDIDGFGSKLASGLGTAAKVGGAAIAAVGTAAVAAGGYMVSAAGNAAQYGDQIDKNSQKLGISAEAYQEWEAVLQHSGTSMESMSATFKTLSNAAQDASDDQIAAFEALGLSMEDVASMSTEDLFAAVISGLQDMEEGTERTAIASDLLGRGAMEMGALLNTSAEDTQAMRDRVRELGGVMSEDAVKGAAAYQDTLQDMQTAFSSLGRNLVTEFLPGITSVMGGLTMLFTDDKDGGLSKISDGIDNIITGITEKLPEFLDVGIEIVDSVLTAIVGNLPRLLNAGADAIMTITKGLLENLPEIVRTGLEVIVSLANGIAQNLPELIPIIVDVILEIVEVLTDPNNLGALVDAAIAIIMGLAEGIINALPRLLEKAPEIIGGLVTALAENIPKIYAAGAELLFNLAKGVIENLPEIAAASLKIVGELLGGIVSMFDNVLETGEELVHQIWEGIKSMDPVQWGIDLVQGFVDGMEGMFGAVWDTATGIADTIKSILGFSEPELGPLSNFHTYAPDMMDLFIQGIEDSKDRLRSTVTSVGEMLSGGFSAGPQITPGGFYPLAGLEPLQSGGKPVTVVLELDGTALGRTMFRLYNDESRRMGVNLSGGEG